MRNIRFIALTLLTTIGMSVFAQTGQYSTRNISPDGKTSTWTFNVVTGSAKTIADGTEDNGIVYVNGGGSNKAQTSQYTSFNKSELYIEVPAGSAGSISMEVSSSSDSRWFQLFINGTEGPNTQRLWSKAGAGTDGKKGPQTFTFASTDISTRTAKTYLHLKTNGTEMKVKSFTITLTSGSYSGGSTPQASTDATLSSIVYGSEQTSVPNFSPETTSYEVEMPATYVGGAPSVQVTTTHSAATPNITQATTLPGTATIVVTAEDGTTQKIYTVTFTKASAAPKVLTATWTNIQGTATVDNVNLTIAGKVKNGTGLTAITPSFTGNNIASWTPNGAQNFTNGAVEYTFSASTGEVTSYQVTITEADPVSSDATLKSLTYGGTSVPNFSASTYVYNIELNAGQKTPPQLAAVANESHATLNITQPQSIPGSGSVEVTAQDGTTKLTYTVNYTVAVPPSDLSIHVPEIYEAPTIAGGYNTPLIVNSGREYEVYYMTRDTESDFCIASTNADKTTGITTLSGGEYSCAANDGWFTFSASGWSSASDAPGEEFATMARRLDLDNTCEFNMRISGYDQFALVARDKKKDTSSGQTKPEDNRYLEVYIDNVLQPLQFNASPTIRRYNVTPGEHVVRVIHHGSEKSAMYAFSLRVAQTPRTKWLRGNDSTQVVMQASAIKQISYVTKYNNIPGADTKLAWLNGKEATGISLQKIDGSLSDTLVLTGNAMCAVGEYNYVVTAYYNGQPTNAVTGKFTVASDIQATSDVNVEVYQNEEMDQITFKYYALSPDSVHLTWINTPEGISGSGDNGKYIIGGTPQTNGTFPYEITVAGADTVIRGTITVNTLEYGDNSVLYLYKNKDAYNQDGVYDYIKNAGQWNLIPRKAKEEGLRPADQYANYKWIIVSEDADANNAEVLAVVRGGTSLPVLNLKGFTYSIDRLGWGEPDNGAVDSTQIKVKGTYLHVQHVNHPIYTAKMNGLKEGDSIQILSAYETKGIMPINIDVPGSLCLGTAYTRNIEDYYKAGELQTALHEIPANMRGGHKYICLPLALQGTLSRKGKNLIDGIVSYLTSPNPSGISAPDLAINKFEVYGVAAKINQKENTITLSVPVEMYDTLETAQPVIELADPNTHLVPSVEPTIDLRYAVYIPQTFVVTDYINRRAYDFILEVYDPEGIEEVYESGMWVNVYDIYGRLVTTTNENIYSMELPHGIYLMVTESGKTIKILK